MRSSSQGGKRNLLWIPVALSFWLVGMGLVFWPQAAEAQCGSSTSSCKNCHEVRGELKVSQNGAWHVQHSFGDFCEFCHAGNVKAKEKAEAHTGLLRPMNDVKGSCQSCHPNDYADRAKKYADVLGVTVSMGGSAPGSGASGTGASGSSVGSGPAAPTGGQIIDLAKAYADLNKPSGPTSNPGNTILIVLILGTLTGLAGLVWHYEKPLPRVVAALRQLAATPVLAGATPGGSALDLRAAFQDKPELSQLWPLLNRADPETLRAVTHLLSDPQDGPRVLRALSQMDLQALAGLSHSDARALTALLALARELN